MPKKSPGVDDGSVTFSESGGLIVIDDVCVVDVDGTPSTAGTSTAPESVADAVPVATTVEDDGSSAYAIPKRCIRKEDGDAPEPESPAGGETTAGADGAV